MAEPCESSVTLNVSTTATSGGFLVRLAGVIDETFSRSKIADLDGVAARIALTRTE